VSKLFEDISCFLIHGPAGDLINCRNCYGPCWSLLVFKSKAGEVEDKAKGCMIFLWKNYP